MLRLSPLKIFVLLWLATTIYIAAVPTRHYTPDAVNNLQFIEAGDVFELWHTQHLLAQWAGYWLYHAGGGSFRAEVALRAAHALLAGLAVGLTYLAARALTNRDTLAIGGGLALWFSYGFWHYASDPDIYIPGYVGAALLLWLYIRWLQQPTPARLIPLSLAAALAILLHQLHIEMAGLIGLTLVWLAWRRVIPPRQVIVYAALATLPVLALYGVGWLHVRAYLSDAGSEPPAFLAWALRYFGTASAGEATWGVSLGSDSLPVALYAWVQTWLISPLAQLSPLYGVALALMGVGAVWLVWDAVRHWRRGHLRIGGRVGAGVVFVCGMTLLANFISGWWWQAGNLKFYLFMQVNLILLAAWSAAADRSVGVGAGGRAIARPYEAAVVGGRDAGVGAGGRAIARPYGLGLVLGGLALAHLGVTLPYETRGGVFSVRDHFPDPTAQVISFDDAWQGVILRHISAHQPRTLAADACDASPAPGAVWVVRESFAADCPALSGLAPLDRYQARREGDWWLIFDGR
jgi:hypothetical protein